LRGRRGDGSLGGFDGHAADLTPAVRFCHLVATRLSATEVVAVHKVQRAKFEVSMQTEKKAYFMVRAQISTSTEHDRFDHWYATHHLPLAMEKLGAEKAWRFWSHADPSTHYAMYQFGDMQTLQTRIASPDFKFLIADFDAAWPNVQRTRDLIELAQEA